MSFLDLTLGVCTDIVINRMGRPSVKTTLDNAVLQDIKRVATAGPVLANAALLMAQGCPSRYMELVRELFVANQLVCPDLEGVGSHKQSVDAECQTASQVSNCHQQTSFTEIKQLVVDSTKLTHCTGPGGEQEIPPLAPGNGFDIYTYTTLSEGEQDIPQVINNASGTPSNDYMNVLSEAIAERSRICEEFESMLQFEDVEDISASFTSVEELLDGFETVKELPLDWVLKKHGIDQSFDDTSYVGMEDQKTDFNGHG